MSDGAPSVAVIFGAFGSLQAVADALEISAQSVWNMKQRNSIPPKYWEKLVAKADVIGQSEVVNLDALARLAAQKAAAE